MTKEVLFVSSTTGKPVYNKQLLDHLNKFHKSGDISQELYDESIARSKDPVVLLVTKVFRELADKFISMNLLVNEGLDNYDPKFFTSIVLEGSKLDTLLHFKNLGIKDFSPESMRRCSWSGGFELAQPIIDYIKEQQKDKQKLTFQNMDKLEGWLRKSEEQATGKVLRAATSYKGKKDHTVRQAAEDLESWRKPEEFSFADTPKQFAEMYSGGAESCMTKREGVDRTWDTMFKADTHPASFYSYHPYVRGIYLMKGKTPIARTLITQKKEGASWEYVRIYVQNDNGKIQKRFEKFLREQSIEGSQEIYNTEAKFSIPGIEQKDGTFICPSPYFDNFAKSAYVMFDEETKEFDIHMCPKNRDTNMTLGHSQNGYIKSTQCKKEVQCCHECGENITGRVESIVIGSRWFCDEDCIESHGAYAFVIGDEGGQWASKRGVAIDIYSEDVFSNLNVARKHSCLAFYEKRVDFINALNGERVNTVSSTRNLENKYHKPLVLVGRKEIKSSIRKYLGETVIVSHPLAWENLEIGKNKFAVVYDEKKEEYHLDVVTPAPPTPKRPKTSPKVTFIEAGM